MADPNLSNRLHPKLRTIARYLPRAARQFGFTARVTSGYRSTALQARLYAEYRAGRSRYPAQPPGQSKHEKGLALDVLSNHTGKLVALLTDPSVGLAWAGPVDPIHFEIPSRPAAISRRTGVLPSAKPIPLPSSKTMTKKEMVAAGLKTLNEDPRFAHFKPW